MREHKTKTYSEVLHTSTAASPVIGCLAGSNGQGDVLVNYNGQGPFTAKLVAGLDRKALGSHGERGREVLLLFEHGRPEQPIIIALMENRLESLIDFGLSAPEKSSPDAVVVDGKRVTIEADEEVLLKCGQGSIHIRKDGTIIIKGTDLLSRSSGPQRIRGTSVNIN